MKIQITIDRLANKPEPEFSFLAGVALVEFAIVFEI
jgi:hypothetical protein